MNGESSHASSAANHLPGSTESVPQALVAELRRHSRTDEAPRGWVTAQLERMASAGAMRWGIPWEFGGVEPEPGVSLAAFERLAAGCLVSTFVLSQRAAAVSRIVASENPGLKAEFLPRLARNEITATVGISHLTTSRQHLRRPSVVATKVEGGYRLDGTIPWVTAARLSTLILTGGVTDDGFQILLLVERDQAGVSVGESADLLALGASETAPVGLDGAVVPDSRIVAGPADAVLKGGGAGGLMTSALALGAAGGVIENLAEEAEKRPDLREIERSFASELTSVRESLRSAADAEGFPSEGEAVRRRANSLALRVSQAYLAASKGAGFVKGHPAERAVREAMFFLVWSCPQPVVHAALREFACLSS